MSDKNEGILIGLLFGGMIALMVCGITIGTMRAMAVKNNVGEWVVVGDYGRAEFRWKPCDRK